MITSKLRSMVRASRKNDLAWRYGFNLGPTLRHAVQRMPLDDEARRVLATLDRDGIAITSVDALLGGGSVFPELVAAVEEIQRTRAAEIEQARAHANDESIGKKTFMLEYLGRNPELDGESVHARFALQPALLGLANAYLGMLTRMRYYNIWHTFASSSTARESQLWHRDREDLYIVKAFVYLNDVDLGAGPFTYAPGTHRKGLVREEPAHHLEGRVKRTVDDQMAAVVPQDRWVTATGKKGTIVLADTNGYHRGGLARTGDRVMYTCMYTSRASESEEFFVRNRPVPSTATGPVAFALR